MTSLPVKGFEVLQSAFPVNNKPSSLAMPDFETVLSRQTAENDAGLPVESVENGKTNDRDVQTKKADDKQEVETSQHQGNVKNEKISEKQPETEDAVPSETEAEDVNMEYAMEILTAASMQVIQQIADTFDVTVETVVAAIDELDMTEMEVLNPESLNNLLLNLGEAEDETALLTDEGLYQKFQTVMNQMTETVEEVSNQLEVAPENLPQIITEVAENQASEMVFLENETVGNDTETDELGESDVKAEGNTSVDAKDTIDEMPQIVQPRTTKPLSEGQRIGQQEQVRRTKAEPQKSDSTQQVHPENLNNAKPQTLQETLQTSAQPTSAWSENTQNIMRQIMDYMRVQLKPDLTSMEMQLHPASLGTVQVQVASKGGVVTAQFVAQNETVKAALESQMIQLRESFEEQGVKVDAIEVTVQTHQFEQNLEQGRQGGQNEPQRRQENRRIRLDSSVNLEDLDSMSEEEALAARMMEANGNTVDYTV
ncbi:MAG: flagellar hook-length control protein FliK [Acetatifactor sp.]|nr:flagellar hook-length control protein FliK [Acetatifactor sp.]